SDTSMSIDSAHSRSPVWKDAHQAASQPDESSPPYSPRLEVFGHSEQNSGPTTATATNQSETPTVGEGGSCSGSGNVPVLEGAAFQKKPSSSIQKCLKCGKGVLKGSTGETSSVLWY